MRLQEEVQPFPLFTIDSVAACEAQASQLWHDLHGPNCAGTRPAQCLVAREDQTKRLLGIAQYFRTFPPEDGCGAVLVVPEAVHGPIGGQLLQAMAEQGSATAFAISAHSWAGTTPRPWSSCVLPACRYASVR
jgi:hypothetical protein